MKKNYLLFLLCALLYACTAQPQTTIEKPEVRFKDGKLRIAQFTDVHWDTGESGNGSDDFLPKLIKGIVESENPDVLVFTGDVVTGEPLVEGWRVFIDLMHEVGLPYAVVMGNHDPEAAVGKDAEGEYIHWETQATRDSIFTYLEKSPLFLGERGPAELKGMGHYTVPVLASDGSDKVMSVLYCMDSYDYSTDPRLDGYGWFSYEQIGWYRQQSKAYTEANGGTSLPSLAFFHIPLPEYHLVKDFYDTIGRCLETPCSPDINTGMYAAMFEMQDIIGIFVGHDHDNDFIGQYNGIALAYGRAAGVDTYGDLKKGGRIIDLYEGQKHFDTWLIDEDGKKLDVYYYPSAISDNDLLNSKMLPASDVNPQEKGTSYKYYEGPFKNVRAMAKEGKLVGKGVLDSFDISGAKADNHFGYEFSSWVNVPETGIYKFVIGSDDGAVLWIDGDLVVDNDGSHSFSEKTGKVHLEKGFHKLDLKYFDSTHGQKLYVYAVDKKNNRFDDIFYVR